MGFYEENGAALAKAEWQSIFQIEPVAASFLMARVTRVDCATDRRIEAKPDWYDQILDIYLYDYKDQAIYYAVGPFSVVNVDAMILCCGDIQLNHNRAALNGLAARRRALI